MLEIAHVMHQFAEDHDAGVRFERRSRARIVTLRGFDEPDRRNLFQVAQLEPTAEKAQSGAAAKVTVRIDERVARLIVANVHDWTPRRSLSWVGTGGVYVIWHTAWRKRNGYVCDGGTQF